MIILNDNQRDAIKKVIDWYYHRYNNTKTIFTICGRAGTGKTTLVNTLVNILGLTSYQVVFTSFTGKAVDVLRRKGCPANTIHKTFYTIRKINGKISFSRKKNLSSAIKLVVIDELSMVNDRMMDDILSFNIPIIGLGDHAQLPPIYGANKYISEPDVVLEHIMRQKGDLGILDLAEMARKGQDIPFGDYAESKVIKVKDIDNIEQYDIILCWKNVTRQNLNVTIRSRLGYSAPYQLYGEKLICLKNNYVHLLEYEDTPVFLVNGMDLISHGNVSLDKDDIKDSFELSYAPSYINNLLFTTKVHKGLFDVYTSGKNYIITGDEDENIVFLDFGYAYTVHKSQGSEFDNVLIIDEFKGASDIYAKWLYTAITRAKKSVTIARYF
jgi:exodeoxyribonuclease-5